MAKKQLPIRITHQESGLIASSGVKISQAKKGLMINGQSLEEIRKAYNYSIGRLFGRYRKRRRSTVVSGRMEFLPDFRALDIYATLRKQGHSHEDALRILSTKEISPVKAR